MKIREDIIIFINIIVLLNSHIQMDIITITKYILGLIKGDLIRERYKFLFGPAILIRIVFRITVRRSKGM